MGGAGSWRQEGDEEGLAQGRPRIRHSRCPPTSPRCRLHTPLKGWKDGRWERWAGASGCEV
eukprot:scaffold183831_cov31-Tisochrysis_lutea.AAC.1